MMTRVAGGAALGLAALLFAALVPVPARADERAGPQAAAPGPRLARSFKPMEIRIVTLRETHPPVWFRSPMAEPSASDAAMDRAILPTAGLGMADWFLFAGRVLAFPVEIALRPPWQTLPLARP